MVAPLSGHYSTLLRNTIETLLRDHDVYITDWKTARDVPVSAGTFGFDEYIDYIIDFLRELGPRKRHHLQPGVGHYGVFSGSKWERQIYPQVRNMVLAMS